MNNLKTLHPDDFDKQKSDYLDTISTIVEDNDIPDSMIVNFDQTEVNIVPSSEWTMELKGEKHVCVAGLGEKRQIALVLVCTLSGELLPPQLIYQRKTEKFHPAFSFPDSWDIHLSPNHWSNTDTMIRYAEKVLIPYFERARDRLDLPSDHPGLAIFDLFCAHQHESFTKLLYQNHIYTKFVPASCTSELQPLDLSGNKQFKDGLKNRFSSWYADRVTSQLNEKKESTDTNPYHVDLRLTYLK